MDRNDLCSPSNKQNKWVGGADNNPYSIEWAKKILFENYNCHVIAKDNNKLKLVKARTK